MKTSELHPPSQGATRTQTAKARRSKARVVLSIRVRPECKGRLLRLARKLKLRSISVAAEKAIDGYLAGLNGNK